RREPEAKKESVAIGAIGVFIRGAPVIDDVVVEELEIAGLQFHREGQLLADFGVEIERLILSRGEEWDAGQLLRGLHEGPRVLRGELALVQREERERVRLALAARLLALAAPPVV